MKSTTTGERAKHARACQHQINQHGKLIKPRTTCERAKHASSAQLRSNPAGKCRAVKAVNAKHEGPLLTAREITQHGKCQATAQSQLSPLCEPRKRRDSSASDHPTMEKLEARTSEERANTRGLCQPQINPPWKCDARNFRERQNTLR